MSLVPKRRFATALAIVSFVLLALAGNAWAAFSATPTRTFGIGSLYGVAADGSFWQASGGTNSGAVVHYDDEGNNLGDGFGFTYSGNLILGAGVYSNRIYMTAATGGFFQPRIVSYQLNSSDPAHDPLGSDMETNERIGGNQAMLRVFPDGGMAVASGQENKVGTLSASDLTKEHPFYGQAFHGAGINKTFSGSPMGFESCVLPLQPGPVMGEPTKCGTHGGFSGPNGPEGLAYPNDVAPGLGGIYVSEKDGDRITHINTVSAPGGIPDIHFGIGPGTGAGQTDEPQSIVRQPSTGYLYVSEAGNRRISVFNAGGGFLAAFGYGVFNGADEMQICGLEIGPCKAGVAYQSDSRSYFSRLDFGPDGDLYAYMPLLGRIQVFAVSGPETPIACCSLPGPGAAVAPGGPAKPGRVPPEKGKVRLKAEPLEVKTGKKTKLTAIVKPLDVCAQRLVLFQEKDERSWDNLGRALKPGKACTASKRVKVTSKSVFRVVLIRSSNNATLGHSPNVTVKLK